MRAISYAEKGPSTVMRLVERPAPEPESGQVRVRMIRAGVNPTDWKSRSDTGSPMAFPDITPGQDGAGIVDAVGTGVSNLAAGDPVWLYLGQHGLPHGTAAEYCVLESDRVVRLPDSLTGDAAAFDLGASLGVPAITAHRALTASQAAARLAPGALAGRVVLVQGGAGAVGNAAIQLAVWAGATVITTVSSPEKGALATAAGAQYVVNYRTQDAAAAIREIAPDGVHLVVEVSPAQNNALNQAVARNEATIAIYANNGGNEVSVPVRPANALNLRYQFLLLYTLDPGLLAAATEDITAAIGAGALRVGEKAGLPVHHYPLEGAPAAHDAVEQGAVGKVLIDIR